MKVIQTTEDSFSFLKKIGMCETKETAKTEYTWKPPRGHGGIEVLGDTAAYYFLKVDYHALQSFGMFYCIPEKYTEIALSQNNRRFYTQTEDGRKEYMADGLSFNINMSPGSKSWLYCPSNTHCSGSSIVLRESYLLLKIQPVIRRQFGNDADPYNILKQAGTLCSHLYRNLLLGLSNSPYTGEAAQLFLDAKVSELMAAIVHAIETMKTREVLYIDEYDRRAIREAQNHLRTNLKNPPNIDELCKMVGINPNKLQTGFRLLTGATVMGYLRSYRMEKALEMLTQQDVLLEDIAREIGYRSPSRFSEAFLKAYGTLPSEYRKALRDLYA